jgi:hypothetical protein
MKDIEILHQPPAEELELNRKLVQARSLSDSSWSIQFLDPNQPGIEHLLSYLADTVDVLMQSFHHPRIDGGLQPFVLRHG